MECKRLFSESATRIKLCQGFYDFGDLRTENFPVAHEMVSFSQIEKKENVESLRKKR